VQGKVRRPGVVRLPAGARVLDALRAAGGPRPGVPTTSLNLARQLADGEQVVLDPAGTVAVGSAAAGGTAGGAADGPVNLNTATLEDLDGLPGVGPVLAQRILDWREEHGRFSAVEELQEVPGIGPSTFADLKDRVRV
jgi:competence protein ComEA